MEGKNIYLSVFPDFLELLTFCLSKLTKTVDLQAVSDDNVMDHEVYIVSRQVGVKRFVSL